MEPDGVPELLQAPVSQCREALADPLADWSDDQWRQAQRVWAASPFVRQWCQRHPQRVAAMLAGELPTIDAQEQADFDRQLRQRRNQAMVRIAWQEILAQVSPEATVRALSDLADDCLARAVRWHRQGMQARHGLPRLADGREAEFCVIGLGKLGGRELNFSSDVDVIFAYSDAGESDGDKPLPNEKYFIRLGQRVVASLNDISEFGFVFRVDLRLRPFGEKSPIAHSLASLEAYYEAHGREWERYAWIKARFVAGDESCARSLIQSLQPFVYRRYLDYGAVAALRDMKAQIDEQVRKRGHEQDIKLGWGGIREVEFVVQVFQLVRGGAEPSLRSNSLMQAMQSIEKLALRDSEDVAQLREAYWFLRRVENCWQAQRDQQSHVLPDDEEPRLALAVACGYPSWDALDTALQRRRAQVHAQFSALFAQPDEQEDDPAWWRWWAAETDEPPSAHDAGRLNALRDRTRRRLSREEDQHALGELLKRLCQNLEEPETTERVLAIVEVLIGRGNYVSLLNANPVARRELIHLCAQSPWLSEEIRQYPMVLSELLDPIRLYAPDERNVLRQRLRDHLDNLPADDIEARMDVLRRVRHATMLRIAAADVSAAIPIMRVSDRLSELAEEILEAALSEAIAQMAQRFDDLPPLEFAVIAYGKLGGLELSYSSDLDLVFVYDGEQKNLPRDPAVFYTRLAQKMIHFLATPTGAGVAYEIDTRLRPSGKSGLLVTSIQGLERYQKEQAWTWEHQALIRARPVAGSPRLASAFWRLRKTILARPRDRQKLLGDVLDMREKMRQELAPKDGSFSPKHSRGGMVDIEFFVQFAVLAMASRDPELSRFTDVIRILESLQRSSLISPDDAAELSETYRRLRALVHSQFLASGEVAPDASTETGEALMERLQRLQSMLVN